MDKSTKKDIKNRINLAKVFDFDYLSANDKLNISVISSNKECFNTGALVSEGSFSLDFVKKATIDAMSLFDTGISDRAFNIMSFTNIYQLYNEDFIFNTDIKYSKINKRMADIDSGYVDVIRVPLKLDELSSLFLGHELICAIKDTNYKEFKNQLCLGEVVPMFYEMLIADKMPEDARIMQYASKDVLN